jgi:hypothetical protein
MEKNIWVSRLARIATRAPHMYMYTHITHMYKSG